MDQLKLEIPIPASTTAPPIPVDRGKLSELVVAMADAIAIVHRAETEADDEHDE